LLYRPKTDIILVELLNIDVKQQVLGGYLPRKQKCLYGDTIVLEGMYAF
jgi:hypothetical protein